ncbi:MAG TPA: DUF4380 domain-containing protein [Cellvibrio sp.]
MFVPLALSAHADVERIILDNGTVAVEITPDIGGRLLSAHLSGQPNFLKTGAAVITEPNPLVTPEANNIGYFGHEIWVGPQSQWWTQQLLNDERRARKAIWPPDPFLILAKNKTVEKTAQQVILHSPNSPISGVAIKKTYTLVNGKSNQIQLDVEATNIRDTSVAWDIWFNTRVPHSAYVYVPVAHENDARIEHFSDATYDGLTHNFSDGIFALENSNSAQKQGRKGKIFIQPSQGWMAAFRASQLFIIQFNLQPKDAIHPEQGQIELYQEFLNAEPAEGLLELEVHAPYKTLPPGVSMSATETWTLLPYDGPATRAAHIAFLKQLKLH